MSANCYLISGVSGVDMPQFDKKAIECVSYRVKYIEEGRHGRRYRFVYFSSSELAIATMLYQARHGLLSHVERHISYIYPEICDPRQ